MRILQVSPYYYPELKFGGPPLKIHGLSQRLAEHGFDVHVVTFHSEWPKLGHGESIDGIKVQYLPWYGKGTWQCPRSLRLLLRAIKQADVVHCYGLYNLICPVAALICCLNGRPYVIEPLGMYIPRAGNERAKRIYHNLFTSRMMRSAAAVIATSPAEAQELAGVANKQQLVTRRNGIDIDLFRNLPDADAFRTRHQLKDDTTVVLYIGRISPIKNLEQLIVAFKEAGLDRARLLMIGPILEPEYAEHLEDVIARLGLSQQVVLTGPLYKSDKLAALAAAALVVLPSVYESFGNAAAEAVAAGVPVLLTDGCGIAPLIHGRAGLAVPANVGALADGLRVMLEDGDTVTKLVAKRDEVLLELSWKQPVEEMEVLYQRIVESAANRRSRPFGDARVEQKLKE